IRPTSSHRPHHAIHLHHHFHVNTIIFPISTLSANPTSPPPTHSRSSISPPSPIRHLTVTTISQPRVRWIFAQPIRLRLVIKLHLGCVWFLINHQGGVGFVIISTEVALGFGSDPQGCVGLSHDPKGVRLAFIVAPKGAVKQSSMDGFVNEDVYIRALIGGKKIIVTEASIIHDLQLQDAEGTACLPNDTIFEELTRMGYDKITQKVLDLEKAKIAQVKEITDLKKRVKKLKKVTEGSSKRAEDELEQESAKRQRLEKEDDSAELKRCLEIVPEDDDDDVTIEATPLSSNLQP
nr:hypothetical protein [Tanacetum cinerariifolium]